MSVSRLKSFIGFALALGLVAAGFQNCQNQGLLPHGDSSFSSDSPKNSQPEGQTFNNGEGYQGNDFVVVPTYLCIATQSQGPWGPNQLIQIRVQKPLFVLEANITIEAEGQRLFSADSSGTYDYNKVSEIFSFQVNPVIEDVNSSFELKVNSSTLQGTLKYEVEYADQNLSDEIPVTCED